MKHTTTFLIPGLLPLIFSASVLASGLSIAPPAAPEGLAFARYIGSIQERSPFTEEGPVAIEIEASLPGLYKQSRLLAIRRMGDSERIEYALVGIEGDTTVTQEVIAPYLKAQEQIDDLPLASLEVTPENYKFRYKGVIGSGETSAYVYQIIPKKKRDGLIQGELWIDSATGAAVLQTGYFVKTPSAFLGRVEVVRDTTLVGGRPGVRVTHVAIQTRRAGRAELTITELPLTPADEETRPESLTPREPTANIQTDSLVASRTALSAAR